MAESLPPEQVRLWLYRPHPQLGGQSPAEVMIQARQTDHVRDLLDQIASGAFV